MLGGSTAILMRRGLMKITRTICPKLADISFAIPFSNAGGSDSFVRKVVVDDPEELTILTVGVLEEDKDFDNITGCCLELGGTSIDVSVPLLGSTLMML